jgi:hypothetical protein
MSDLYRFSSAEQLISTNDIDKAWSALHWIFCSTDLEYLGFYQTATRLGVSPEQYKIDLLERSQVARDFYYGNDNEES